MGLAGVLLHHVMELSVKITSGIHHFKVATHRKLLSPADHIEVMRTYPLHRGVNNWI